VSKDSPTATPVRRPVRLAAGGRAGGRVAVFAGRFLAAAGVRRRALAGLLAARGFERAGLERAVLGRVVFERDALERDVFEREVLEPDVLGRAVLERELLDREAAVRFAAALRRPPLADGAFFVFFLGMAGRYIRRSAKFPTIGKMRRYPIFTIPGAAPGLAPRPFMILRFRRCR